MVFALVAGIVVVYSWIHNWPIRFRPKWAVAPGTLQVLYPTSDTPDNIVLTPAGDMASSLSIAWRTSSRIADGIVQYRKGGITDQGGSEERQAAFTEISSPELKGDRNIHCFAATLDGLEPGTTYSYRVGSKEQNAWSDYASFTTAEISPPSFSFVYMADTQIKPARVGNLMDCIEKQHPETVFYMISGDIVDMGDWRNLWDDFLANTHSVFSRKPLAPTMGNHDAGDKNYGSVIFNAYFNTQNRNRKTPNRVENYSFRYGPAYFIVINQFGVSAQTKWLEKELQTADAFGAKFKVVMFHHPVYNPRSKRQKPDVHNQWVPLFDRYKVDFVLTGHDHSYVRSKPLNAGKPVPEGQFGTTYIVSTACEKFYPYDKLDIAEVQFTDVPTYQVITFGVGENGEADVKYRAYSYGENPVDSFEYSKQ